VNYERLADGAERQPRKVRDHSATWAKLTPLTSVNGDLRGRVARFCAAKQISPAALEALGTRIAIRGGGSVWLAFAGHNGADVVTAIKYRPLDGSSHETKAEEPSAWLNPIVIGKRDALDWFIAEGETDAARLFDLIGEDAAVLCLPAGARAFKSDWAAPIPRGATVYLCHDGDEDGDAGAEKAARIIGGATVRVRPPVDGGDWCEWEGDRAAFVELVRAARGEPKRFEFLTGAEFMQREFPTAEPLLGQAGEILLAAGSLLMVYGADGSGKTIDAIAHLASGTDWLGVPVPRPVRICVIENEGPPDLFKQKLARKVESWSGPPFLPNLYFYVQPWGEFSFADPDCRAALAEFCEEHAIDVVTANPTLGLGVSSSGRPDETQQFVDWLTECGLKSTRAFWLLHHENKAGQISGDWGRHPDTKVSLQHDGNLPRTKLDWAKTRWATLPSETIPKVCLLEWVLETQGYNLLELDTAGASDEELEARIRDYLDDNPMAPTRAVKDNVKGSNDRILRLLKERFDCVPGARGANLWLTWPSEPGHVTDTSGANPHE
jgi:hypothetical protein